MTQPTKPTAPLPALRSDPDTFSARLEANILFWPTHLTFIDESNTFNAGLSAALVAGNLPSLVGNELDALRVNAAGDGVEFVDVTAAGWTFLAAADAAAQRTALEIPTPTGQVAWYAVNTAPTGTLKANGAAVSRTTYAALFAVIGTTFGAGDGSTTFNLPDMRGEFARGWDDGRGIDTGRAFGSAQTDAFQGHGHTLRGTVTRSNSGNQNEFSDGTHSFSNTTSVEGPTTFGSFGTVRTANETRPRNIALLAVIFF